MSSLLRKHCVQRYIWGVILLLSDVVFVHFAAEFMTGAVCLQGMQIDYNSVVRDRLCVCVHMRVCVCVCVYICSGEGLLIFILLVLFSQVEQTVLYQSVVGVKIHYLNYYHFSHAHMLSSRCS